MNSFLDKFEKSSWADVAQKIKSSTKEDIENAIHSGTRCGLDGLASLLSPLAGKEYLEEMAQ